MRHLRLLAGLLATSTALPPALAAAAEAPPSLVAAPALEGVEELPPPPIEPPLASESESEVDTAREPERVPAGSPSRPAAPATETAGVPASSTDPTPEEERTRVPPAAPTPGFELRERSAGRWVVFGLGAVAVTAGVAMYGDAWIGSLDPVPHFGAAERREQSRLGGLLIAVGVVGVLVGYFLPEDA